MCGMLKLTVGSTLIAWFVGGGEWGNRFHEGFGVVGLPKGLGNSLMKSLATWCMELTPSGRSFLWIGNTAFLLLENQGGLRRLLAFCHCSMGSLSRLSGLRGIMMFVFNSKQCHFQKIQNLIWNSLLDSGRVASNRCLGLARFQPSRKHVLLESCDKIWGKNQVICLRIDSYVQWFFDGLCGLHCSFSSLQ